MSEVERERLFAEVSDAVLAALPNAWAIYVYGSFARGDEWPTSDVDVAVLLPPGNKIPDRLGLMSAISGRVHRDVDLVDLREASDTLRREVLADGRVLFTFEPGQVLAWEASAMSRYARHREEIRDLLEDFNRTGVGYRS